MDFIETITLTGQRQYILAAIEHTTRRIQILGTTAHPTADRVTQTIKNLVMDVQDVGIRGKFLIRDRDTKHPALIDEILAAAGIRTVLPGVRMPRMNSITERWVCTLRRELLDRTLILERAAPTPRPTRLRAPLRSNPSPQPLEPERIASVRIRRHDRLGGVLHKYWHAA
ncbi:IS481 family transposase [Streptomyces sp. NPDC057889]|uniref:IS481 family transposase n=1 Tax=unclassified Streptomyces TaxID=2593676 RepID=UPI0036AA5806